MPSFTWSETQENKYASNSFCRHTCYAVYFFSLLSDRTNTGRPIPDPEEAADGEEEEAEFVVEDVEASAGTPEADTAPPHDPAS